MPTPAEIEEQQAVEREQITYGLARYDDNVIKLEDKTYASATDYGTGLIQQLLPAVAQRLEEKKNRLEEGKAGVSYREVKQYIDDLDRLVIAAIGCKITFDYVFGYKKDSNTVASVTAAIGCALEDECRFRFYERTAPGLFHKIKERYFHSASGTHQKVRTARQKMNKYDVEWKTWPTQMKVRIGGYVLDAIIECSHWFDRITIRNKKRTVGYIIPSAELMDRKDQILEEARKFTATAWPMIIPPMDWSNDEVGGYYLGSLQTQYQLVRRGDRQLKQGETPLDFLNKIQRVAYRLNPFIVDVAEKLMEKGESVGKFLPIIELPIPPKPVDIAENKDSKQAYKRAAAEVMNKNAQAFKRACRTRMTMEAVARFKDREKFYIPWSFDYRGRTYPIPAFLTPQDTDFGKSLLKFYEEAFVDEYAEGWLAFQVATTFGLDKAPMSERLAWTRANHDLITIIATDPLSNIPEWEGVDEPWQFLAACEEYYHCCIKCDRSHTSLMVATDATCSGLQILAGLARDASTARLVNVLPSDKPQDAYKVVAEAAKPNCPTSIQPLLDRKVVKRVVMTVPYNAKPYSNRGYIREALKEKDVDIDKDDLTATVKAVRDAMNVVVPGPMAVMSWIEKEVARAIKSGLSYLTWTTPSGFVVKQKLMKREELMVDLQLLGRCRIKLYGDETDEVDLAHHKNATAPNLIHSLDASLLHLSALRFDAPIALIHDSVLCRATDMSTLSTLVRETYMHLFAEHDYLNTFASQIDAETAPPIVGDLEPESVIESTYFFC
jgi:DNA-directed RNA polymerase